MHASARLLLAVRVNGRPLEALLDSAAEASFLDRRIGAEMGLVEAESVTARGSGEKNFDVPLVKGVTLEAAGLTLRDQTIAMTDLSDVGRKLLEGAGRSAIRQTPGISVRRPLCHA